MKILVVGDIHGNLPAFELLLKKEKDSFDELICHGDVVNYGPWSNDCVQLLDSLPNTTRLMGNHEQNYISGDYSGKHPVARAFFEFCYPRFDHSLFELIKGYEQKAVRADFTIKHTINDQYIFADTDISHITINENFIIGHSHQAFEREKDGYKIVNTGSLGQNRQHINKSCYLMLDTESNAVELKSFVNDVDMVIDQMRSEDYPPICIDYYLSKKRI